MQGHCPGHLAPAMPACVPALGGPGRTGHTWLLQEILGSAGAAGTWTLVLDAAGLLLPAPDAACGLAPAAILRRDSPTPAPRPWAPGPAIPAVPCAAVPGRRASLPAVPTASTRRAAAAPGQQLRGGRDNQEFLRLFGLRTALRGFVRGEWDPHSPVPPRTSLTFLLLGALKGFLRPRRGSPPGCAPSAPTEPGSSRGSGSGRAAGPRG